MNDHTCPPYIQTLWDDPARRIKTSRATGEGLDGLHIVDGNRVWLPLRGWLTADKIQAIFAKGVDVESWPCGARRDFGRRAEADYVRVTKYGAGMITPAASVGWRLALVSRGC